MRVLSAGAATGSLLILGACAALTPDQARQLALDVAGACQAKYSGAIVRYEVDPDLRLNWFYRAGSPVEERQAFAACYRERVQARLRWIPGASVETTAPAAQPTTGSAPERPPEPETVRSDAPIWKPGYEWVYRWESARGTGTFAWTVTREETVDGAGYYVIASGGRELYYRKSDLAESMEKVAGIVEVRWIPPSQDYVWPLAAGGQWEQQYAREMVRDRQVEDTFRVSVVEAIETIVVPAGTFQAFKLVYRNKRSGDVLYERWYAPAVKQWIRDRSYLPYGVRTRELTGFRLD